MKQVPGDRAQECERCFFLYGLVRARLPSRVKFEQRPEGSRAASHVAIWGKKVLVRDNGSGRAQRQDCLRGFGGRAKWPKEALQNAPGREHKRWAGD